MYRIQKPVKSIMQKNDSYQGEWIEEKIRRITSNKEPISDGAPLVYTDRKDGVKPEYDIRTDRFEIAVDGMDKVSKSMRAKRENVGKIALEGMKKEGGNGGAEPAQATPPIGGNE